MTADPPSEVFESYKDETISDELLKQAAQLFSENYGIWGPMAEEQMGGSVKRGRRVRMSVNVFKQQCLSSKARNIYLRLKIDGHTAGHVLATRWKYEGRDFCWISQLVVGSHFRRQGVATRLLLRLREQESVHGFGILSSHPAAIRAALRAFGRGLDEVDLKLMKRRAGDMLASAPVGYVQKATLRGSLFEATQDGTVSLAYTGFWVDHGEPSEALAEIREQGKVWPFGLLLEGHEFLAIATVKYDQDRGSR